MVLLCVGPTSQAVEIPQGSLKVDFLLVVADGLNLQRTKKRNNEAQGDPCPICNQFSAIPCDSASKHTHTHIQIHTVIPVTKDTDLTT